MRISFLLPLPPRELSPNFNSPWAPKAKWFRINARKQYRRDVGLEVRQYVSGMWLRFLAQNPRLRLTETYYIAGRRKRDLRNLFAAFKAGEDGLVDAGILLGDDDSMLEHGPPRIERVKTKAEEGVRVIIEEIG